MVATNAANHLRDHHTAVIIPAVTGNVTKCVRAYLDMPEIRPGYAASIRRQQQQETLKRILPSKAPSNNAHVMLAEKS
jgi:hypothetical protein